MEAMACGVPCVGFKVGGIPEEIDHRRNGYVAEYRNAEDLARGIRWILTEADYEALSKNVVHKVMQSYSQQSVALKYLDVYHQAMAFKHYNL
jgi:glycosyltransferase involved in cell wall biosynthesis